MNNPTALSKRIITEILSRKQVLQWEEFIAGMLKRLELLPMERAKAEQRYQDLANHVSQELGIGLDDVHVVVQGSMRTKTTISPRGNQKFDLDIVVKLSGPSFAYVQSSEEFFQRFGNALQGITDAGDPSPKKRCWRLQYPNEPFYFDVTPAIPGSRLITRTDLRVRDPETVWSPSNPEEFADWFEGIAKLRFPFTGEYALLKAEALGRARVDPIPDGNVDLDDILRRTLQLIKLHRDNYYHLLPPERKDAKPISIILVTLAGHAYEDLYRYQGPTYSSPIEVALEVVDRLPHYVDRSLGDIRVENPKLPGENFADRWNKDDGLRDNEFKKWHKQVTQDLEALFAEDYDARTEARIRSVFGEFGVKAWKDSQSQSGVFQGLLGTTAGTSRINPTSATRTGSRNTLA